MEGGNFAKVHAMLATRDAASAVLTIVNETSRAKRKEGSTRPAASAMYISSKPKHSYSRAFQDVG